MPPTNVSFLTALDLGSTLPINNTQSDINDAGVNFTVFYKFTCPANLVMVWAWATSDQVAGYTPKMTPYDAAEVEILEESSVVPPIILGNNPIQFPVTPGAIHYLQVVKNADSVGPEHVDLQIRAVPNTATIPFESIVVNGDIINQPCGIFSPTIDYTTIKFVSGVAVGEGGCITKSGKTLFDNRILADRMIKLYNTNYVELGTEAILAFAWIRRNQVTGFFWILVMENVAFSSLYKLDPEVLPLAKTLVATITVNSAGGISTNNAETIAYFRANVLGTAVMRWDLVNDVALSDLVAAPTVTSFFSDSMVLEDDTILVGWSDGDATGIVTPIRYSPAGAVLNTYGPFDSYEANFGDARLAYGPDSPASFWLKLRERSASLPTGNAIFKKIRVSDGAVLVTRTYTEFTARNYIGPAAVSYPGESGIWNSCPFVVMPVGVTPTPSGIYVITPNGRSDNYIAIPNPTFKTALMP